MYPVGIWALVPSVLDIDLGWVPEGPSRRGSRRTAEGLGQRMSHVARDHVIGTIGRLRCFRDQRERAQ